MARSGQEQLIYGQLATLKDFIPEDIAPGSFVDLFHGILDDLENFVGDLTRYRVPDSAIRPSPQTSEQMCAAPLLQAKVDDVMNLFYLPPMRRRIESSALSHRNSH